MSNDLSKRELDKTNYIKQIDKTFLNHLHRLVTEGLGEYKFPICIPSSLQKVAWMRNSTSRHLSMQGMKWECYYTLFSMIQKTLFMDINSCQGTTTREPLKQTAWNLGK